MFIDKFLVQIYLLHKLTIVSYSFKYCVLSWQSSCTAFTPSLTILWYSCAENQSSWQSYYTAMTIIKKLTVFLYSCDKSLTIFLYSFKLDNIVDNFPIQLLGKLTKVLYGFEGAKVPLTKLLNFIQEVKNHWQNSCVDKVTLPQKIGKIDKLDFFQFLDKWAVV